MSAFALSLLLWFDGFAQPPVLPPEPTPPSLPSEPPPTEPTATEPTATPPTEPPPTQPTEPPALPSDIEIVEFPLDASSQAEPLPRMDASSTRPPSSERRSIVDLRDPFDRPPLRPRTASHGQGQAALAQQRLMMPDLKDPFADGTRRVRSRTLDLRVPSDLRDPFRDGLGRQRARACERTTGDGTVVQAPGSGPGECTSEGDDLRDPFRPNPPHS